MKHNARNTDPQPSHDAAKTNRMGRGTHARSMLRAFHRAGIDGYTDHEAALVANLHYPGICWWHRASDLRDAGLIEWQRHPDGVRVTRRGDHGVNVGVSVITDAGREFLK